MAATAKQYVEEAPLNDVIKVRNPRTGEPLYEVPCATLDEIAETFARAHLAFQILRKMTVKERLNELTKIKHYLIDHRKEIVDTVVRETGKNRALALGEIIACIETINDYQNQGAKWLAEQDIHTPVSMAGKKSKLYFEPAGPTLVIGPWNFPLITPMEGILAALVSGNSVVFKPSEWTQLCGLFEKIFNDSGFVKDAVQIVYGGKDTGRVCVDAKPKRIIFVGSSAVGKKVMSHAGRYLIPVIMECGGKDPMIVCEDADIDRAVEGATTFGLLNSGQICASIERLIVHESVHEEFVTKLVKRMQEVTDVSHLDDEDTGQLEVGSMTTDFNIDIIENQIDDAIVKGAKIVTGGRACEGKHEFEPTLVDEASNDMTIVKDETFGPVMTTQTFSTDEEAIQLANNSRYGLTASVWTSDETRAENLAREIETGHVSINNHMQAVLNPSLPWGGVKDTGVGRYHGEIGLQTLSNVKTVVVDKNTKNDPGWFPNSQVKYELLDELVGALKQKSLSDFYHLIHAAMGLNKFKK